MLPREITIKEANIYAKQKGMKILAEVPNAIVVQLPNGSTSNITTQTISDHLNKQNYQPKGSTGNQHSASFEEHEAVIDNHSAKKLYAMGIGKDVTSSNQLSDQQRVNAASQGISGAELNNLLNSRNTSNAKKAQKDYFFERDEAIQAGKQRGTTQNSSPSEADKQASLRASHGLPQKRAEYLEKKISQQINPSKY